MKTQALQRVIAGGCVSKMARPVYRLKSGEFYKIFRRSRIYVYIVVLLTLLLATTNSAGAQTKPDAQKKPILKTDEIFTAVKPGQWVKLKGSIRKDFSVLCTKVKIITGEFHEDDWSITAIPRSINRAKQDLKLLLMPIKIQKDTQFESKTNAAFKSFADLKAGMLVEVDGTYLKNDTLLATEIEDVSSDLVAEPGLENQVEAAGKVEKVNAANRTMKLMGITFQLTDETKGKWAVKSRTKPKASEPSSESFGK